MDCPDRIESKKRKTGKKRSNEQGAFKHIHTNHKNKNNNVHKFKI
jgi:hypothetical protein